jgi:hypothetical protein
VAVVGLALAIVNHPPALHGFRDEGVGVWVAGLRHSIHKARVDHPRFSTYGAPRPGDRGRF